MLLLTELDAVNEMLLGIGEPPVASLDGLLPSYTSRALSVLRRVSRNEQTDGLWFNTVYDVTLSLDSDSKIPLSNNAIIVEVARPWSGPWPVVRNGFLYDVLANTDVFDEELTADRIVYLLDWDSLPDSARQYYTKQAVRVFRSEINQTQEGPGIDEVRARKRYLRDGNRTEKRSVLHYGGPAAIVQRTDYSP